MKAKASKYFTLKSIMYNTPTLILASFQSYLLYNCFVFLVVVSLRVFRTYRLLTTGVINQDKPFWEAYVGDHKEYRGSSEKNQSVAHMLVLGKRSWTPNSNTCYVAKFRCCRRLNLVSDSSKWMNIQYHFRKYQAFLELLVSQLY